MEEHHSGLKISRPGFHVLSFNPKAHQLCPAERGQPMWERSSNAKHDIGGKARDMRLTINAYTKVSMTSGARRQMDEGKMARSVM